MVDRGRSPRWLSRPTAAPWPRATSLHRNNVRIWDVATGRPLATLEGHTDRVRAVAFAPDGKSLATASSDGTVRLWDVASWRERSVLKGHADSVHAVAFSPDGKTLASAGNDGDVRLWDLSNQVLRILRPVFSTTGPS